ncbi:hypothetical protein [Clostridium tarantellae]|nr:hypothetical protein [Clostridium tarantellae]
MDNKDLRSFLSVVFGISISKLIDYGIKTFKTSNEIKICIISLI